MNRITTITSRVIPLLPTYQSHSASSVGLKLLRKALSEAIGN